MKTTTLTLALSALIALSACAAPTSGSAADSPSSGANRPSTSAETSETAPAADALGQPTAEEGMPVQDFGEAFTYSDGIQITVGEPTSMTSGEWASPENTQGSAFTVTIVNGSQAPFDPSMANISVQSANTEAEQIFDSEGGYGSSPETTLLPGREASYKVAFATSDPKDLVVEATPSWDHVAALYATNGG